MDRYVYNFDEGCVNFSIGQKSGKCLSYFIGLKNNRYLDITTGSQISEDECREIAAEYLTELLENSDQFEYEEVITHSISELGGDVHTFYFTKKVEGMWTYERAYVEVTSYGDIIAYNLSFCGNISINTLPKKYDSDKIGSAVNDRLDRIYESVQGKYDEITYSVQSERLVRVKGGKYGILYEVVTTLTDSDGRPLQDPSMFLVYLD
ncbi:MAG: YcdB/YcdC domain-containing protein [Eubacteriales bacterium]